MEEREFVAGSKDAWARLARGVSDARRTGISKMGGAALRQLHEDYRRTAADLAYAQTHFPGSDSAAHLNRLVAQAHGELYGSSRPRVAGAWRFVAVEFPALLRANRRTIGLSAALFGGSALVGFALVWLDPALAKLLVPGEFREGITGSPGAKGANEQMLALAPLVSAFLAVNNVRVALLAFAGGMTAGLVTVWALLNNGALLGSLAGMFTQARLSLPFWGLIVPHGALELPAIVIAGAAGLKLAGAMLFPGDLPRSAAIKAAAPVAVRLLLGTVPMFALAALIEGFFTPSALDPAVKLGAGVLVAAGLAAYWALAGRTSAD